VGELEKCINQLQLGRYSWSDLYRFCNLVRTGGHRSSRLLVKYGSELLDKYFNKLGTQEAWDIVEQVLIGAIDSGEHEIANKYLKWMENKFSNSSIRVLRLKGMLAEAQQNYEDAIRIYDKILKQEPGQATILKRRISIEIEKGKRKDAITLLNEYLELFSDDTEGWLELANLYLKEQLYDYAAYCFEELILIEPHNYHYYIKYAEIKYSIPDYPLALKYFIFALELSKENITAFYGLLMTMNKIGKLTKEEEDLKDWAVTQLLNIYKEDDKLEIIKACTTQYHSKQKEEPQEDPENDNNEEPSSKHVTHSKNTTKKGKRRNKNKN